MKLNTSTTLAALVLIGAGGFMAGRVSSSSSAPSVTTEVGPADIRSPRTSAAATASAEGRAGAARAARQEKSHPETKADRLAKLESIVRGENPLDRNRALLAYIDQLGPGEFEDAVAHFRELGLTESRLGEYSLLLTAWAAADPLSALDYARANTRNSFATDTILTSWASTDPEAAIRWANSNFTGEGANPYLAGIIKGIAESNPARATELLTSMPRSEERAKGLDALVPHLLRQGADATRAWIAALTDESLKNGAMIRTAESLARTDPAGTASWLLANPGEAADRRLDDVYSTWAQKDQQAALSSFSSLPPGPARSNALRGVVSTTAVQNPKAAAAMLNQYAKDVTDRVVQTFVWHSYGADPVTAVSEISRIGDEERRNQMYRRTVSNWLERDPTSAQAWLSANPLPENVLKDLDAGNRR